MESFQYMILLIDNHLKILKTGQLKLINMEIKMLLNYLLEINLIYNLIDKLKLNKEKLQQNHLELNSLKHQQKTLLMQKKPSQLYQIKLNLKYKEDQIKVNQLKEIQELLLEKLKKPKRKQEAADIYLNYSYNFFCLSIKINFSFD